MKRRDFLIMCGAGSVLCGPIKSYADECPSKEDTLESLCEEFDCQLESRGIQHVEDSDSSLVFLHRNGIFFGVVNPVQWGQKMPLREQFVLVAVRHEALKKHMEAKGINWDESNKDYKMT
jgi:hypothetical protein